MDFWLNFTPKYFHIYICCHLSVPYSPLCSVVFKHSPHFPLGVGVRVIKGGGLICPKSGTATCDYDSFILFSECEISSPHELKVLTIELFVFCPSFENLECSLLPLTTATYPTDHHTENSLYS